MTRYNTIINQSQVNAMKLLFASDSFKGSLTSQQTIELLTKAAKQIFPDCVCCGVPVADGGEGTVDAIVSAADGRKCFAKVHDPLMKKTKASYGILDGNKAIIEMSAASGLTLVPDDQRNPLLTTTFGTGELILDALNQGCRDITVAIGGSATNDGGMGCMKALGVKFLSADGKELSGIGINLAFVSTIDTSGMDSRLKDCQFTVMCDVKNPLCGQNGATRTFAKQKGASEKDIEQLEAGMIHYGHLIHTLFGIDCDAIEGAGAAGGLGAALKVFLQADMRSGIETVLRMIHFDEKLRDADLVITGEGCTDSQSVCGKVIQGVGWHAKKYGIPCIGLSGSLGEGSDKTLDDGLHSLHCIVNRPMTLSEAMSNAEALYYDAAVRLFRTIRVGMEIAKAVSK